MSSLKDPGVNRKAIRRKVNLKKMRFSPQNQNRF